MSRPAEAFAPDVNYLGSTVRRKIATPGSQYLTPSDMSAQIGLMSTLHLHINFVIQAFLVVTISRSRLLGASCHTLI